MKLIHSWMFVYVTMLPLVCFSPIQSFAKDHKISQNEASQIISKHFEDFYGYIEVNRTHEYCDSVAFGRPKQLDAELQGLAKWKTTGLIDYQVKKVAASATRIYTCHLITVTLTEKGRNTPHIGVENNVDRVAFQIAKRNIIKIIEIAPSRAVYFSFMFEPNEVGVTLGNKSGKYRGKAKIFYDPFLEKYLFKGVEFSPWETEEWYETSWVDQIEGKKIVRGYK